MRPDFIYVNTLNAGTHIKYQVCSIKLNIKDLQTHKKVTLFFNDGNCSNPSESQTLYSSPLSVLFLDICGL